MRLVGIIVLIALSVVWWWRRAMKPAPNRIESPDHLANAIDYFLRRGIHGGSVRFQIDDDASRAVVLTKYIVAHGNVGFSGRANCRAESEERIDSFRRDLTARGLNHTVTHAGGAAAVEIECGRDVGLGVMFVVLAFGTLFNTKLAEHCVAYFEGVAISSVPSITGVDEPPER